MIIKILQYYNYGNNKMNILKYLLMFSLILFNLYRYCWIFKLIKIIFNIIFIIKGDIMDVLGALKYFRKKKKLLRKMFCQKGKQTYRRIEIGEAKLSYEDLMTALQSLGITFNEFFMVSDTRIMASSEVKHQIECCQMGLNNTSEKRI